MSKMSIDENRRCAAIGMALQANEVLRNVLCTEDLVKAAKAIEAYLKGAAPEPKCFTQPDPTFKNEVLNDVDA